MTNLYSCDLRVWCTAYVKAKDKAEALEKIKDMIGFTVQFTNGGESNVEVSGARFDDPDLPEASISPVGTIEHRQIIEVDDVQLAEKF